MTLKKLDFIAKELVNLKNQGLFTNIRTVESPIDSRIKVDGKWVINFCSNNYLGLANNNNLKKAAKKAIDRYGVGPAAVRTIAGTTKLHLELEKALAKFKKTEDVITFQSGFLANCATIPALMTENDIIFSDELNHASIIDACRLSRAEVVRYKHQDIKDLELKILARKKAIPDQKRLIVTDGVFSMDGDIAPLPKIVSLAERFDALVMVDDAHGEGVLGTNGRGLVDHFKLHGRVDVEIGTLSKAFGVVGGYAAGKKLIIDWLRQRGRPFLFSSAMTSGDVAACIEGVKIISHNDKLVRKLWQNTNYFKNGMVKLGFDIGKSETPIIPIMLGEARVAQEFSNKLFESGVFAKAITYPTVPQGSARIRVIISASHSRQDLDKALKIFESVGKNLTSSSIRLPKTNVT